MLHHDHPAEQIRAIIAELDELPPPPPAPRPTPPPPRPVAFVPPPAPIPFDWAAFLRSLRPVLIFVAIFVLGFALYLRTH